jgi:hypothetical protein
MEFAMQVRVSKIRPEDLLIAGYQVYKHPVPRDPDSYIASYQKRFDDQFGKKYFINIAFSRLSIPGHCDMEFMAAEVQFTRDGVVFNVETSATDMDSLSAVEAFYESMWTTLCCSYYERGF